MNRNHLPLHRTLLALIATGSLLAACGQRDDDPSAHPDTTSPSMSDSAVDPPSTDDTIDGGAVVDPASATTADDSEYAADAVNQFGADLLAASSAERPTENVVVSPLSVATALSMTSLGARGTTAEEMATVLGGDTGSQSADPAAAMANDYQPSMISLLASLDERATSDDAQVDIANAVWGQADYKWNPDFTDALVQQYRSELRTVDFGGNPDGARDEINRWVAEATNDRIVDLLGGGSINDLTRMVLVNAVYLKADWETPFDPNSTWDQEFTTATGDTVEVPMMHTGEDLNAAKGEGWTAVELPYQSSALSLVVTVPDAETGADPATPMIDDVVDQLREQKVELTLPKFEIDTKTGLKGVLSQLGMPTAFDANAADFSGMTDGEPLHIADVIHQANITVDEEGTEAAAATAVEMAAGAAPSDEEFLAVNVDRPFTFWLRDTETGVVLFTGHVNNPQL